MKEFSERKYLFDTDDDLNTELDPLKAEEFSKGCLNSAHWFVRKKMSPEPTSENIISNVAVDVVIVHEKMVRKLREEISNEHEIIYDDGGSIIYRKKKEE